jgi:hypothetical protein
MNLEFKLSDIQPNVKKLTDRVLLYQMDLLNVHERKVTVLVLRHLREIECRRLFVDLGFSSMHVYCIKHLKYSESQTQRRLSSARLMTELPEIEKDIQAGSLNLTNLAKFQSFARAERIASHPLNKEEKLEMLSQIQNKPTRQVERELIQKSHQPELLAEKYHNISVVMNEVGQTNQFSKFEALLSEANQELLQEFKNLYAHELKDQANVSVLMFLLTKAVQHKKKQKVLIIKPKNNATPPSAPKVNTEVKPKLESKLESESVLTPKSKPTPELKPKLSPLRKVVSAPTRRFIWHRAGDCCEQVVAEGKKCRSKYALEIDHIIGVALGGTNDIENLQLLCRAHNSRRAIKAFGVYRGSR